MPTHNYEANYFPFWNSFSLSLDYRPTNIGSKLDLWTSPSFVSKVHLLSRKHRHYRMPYDLYANFILIPIKEHFQVTSSYIQSLWGVSETYEICQHPISLLSALVPWDSIQNGL